MSAEATLKESTSKKAWGGGISPYGVSWGKMYMWFFLVSDAFTFSTLLTAYGTLRHRYAEIWPKASDVFTHFPFYEGHMQLAYVALMTFILIMSSVTMVLAVDAGHLRNNKGVALWLGLTIIGGLMFVGSQAWEWYHFIKGTEHGAYILTDGTVAHHAATICAGLRRLFRALRFEDGRGHEHGHLQFAGCYHLRSRRGGGVFHLPRKTIRDGGQRAVAPTHRKGLIHGILR